MERFFEKVNKIPGGCWLWTAAVRGKSGYGAIKIDRVVFDAHRVPYEIHNGPIPDGMLVCHSCDNRRCVNPDHLFLGTYSDNMQDCKNKGRLVVPLNTMKHPSHGSYRRGCRCSGCKDLKKIVQDRWRAKQQAQLSALRDK